MELWSNNTEIAFFDKYLKEGKHPEHLFYRLGNELFAYAPRDKSTNGQTLQSRNGLIGQFTENWCKTLFEPIAKQFSLYAINGVICEELGLSNRTSADLAFCTTNSVQQQAKNIKLLFEIKMCIVSNYKFIEPDMIALVGDYKQHKGNPSLLRSDSMLKAIGKSINIRVSGSSANQIPIIVLGNSPITDSYISKVDYLKSSGVLQGFWSLNPTPSSGEFIKQSPKYGFRTINNEQSLLDNCKSLIDNGLSFFSSMVSKPELGKLIRIASQESDDIARAEKFLSLMQGWL